MQKLLWCGLAALLLAAPAANAQITIDAGKITCDQFFTLRDPFSAAIWLSGYFHGQKSDTVIDVEAFKKNASDLRAACRIDANRQLPVMQVIEKSGKAR
jgi:HdeA/HdeB family protein